MSLNCQDNCQTACGYAGLGLEAVHYGDDGDCGCTCGGCPMVAPGGGMPNKKPMRKMRFGGMNPVQQRSIGVNPSRGGFFSLPSGERNFGQQGALPYDQQLNMNHKSNFAHSNASGCGYSNMNHSNFGANTASNTWSGAQTNVGPQDRIYAGNYASGERYSNFLPCNDSMDCGGASGCENNGGQWGWYCVGGDCTSLCMDSNLNSTACPTTPVPPRGVESGGFDRKPMRARQPKRLARRRGR